MKSPIFYTRNTEAKAEGSWVLEQTRLFNKNLPTHPHLHKKVKRKLTGRDVAQLGKYLPKMIKL